MQFSAVMRSFPLPSWRLIVATALLVPIGCSSSFDDTLSDNTGVGGKAGASGKSGGAGGRAGGGAGGASGKAGAGGKAGGAGAAGKAGAGGFAGAAGKGGASGTGLGGAAGTNAGSGGTGGNVMGKGGTSGTGGAGGASGTGGAGGTNTNKGGAGGASSQVCLPKSTRCNGANRETCASNGSGYTASVTCAIGCKDDQCIPCVNGFTPSCTPAGAVTACTEGGVATTSSCGAQTCENGACVSCPTGSPIKCVGLQRVGCEGGKQKIIETCGPNLCAAEGCLQCSTGQKSCNGTTITTCQGGQFVAATECAPLACSAGACVPECSGNQRRCQGQALQQCVGGVYTTLQQCEATETCDENANLCRACTDGTTRCNGLVSESCNQGKWATSQTCTAACVQQPEGPTCYSSFVAVAAGPGRTCVLASPSSGGGARAVCWGASSQGELGTITGQVKPQVIPGSPTAAGIAMGRAHTCLLTDGGQVRCVGANNHGQLGRTTVGNDPSAAFANVSGLGISPTILEIVAGDDLTCAKRLGGIVDCWGQFPDGTWQHNPKRVATSGVAVLTSGRGSLGLHSTGVSIDPMRAFGANHTGQLGTGSASPTTVEFPGTDVTLIKGAKSYAAGGERTVAGTPVGHGCAVDRDNTLWCWGLNDNGQIGSAAGDTNVTIEGALRKVAGLPTTVFTDAGFVVAGRTHTCATRNNVTAGAVWCFGENPDARAGQSLGTASAPQQVSLPGSAAGLALGDDHTCALVRTAAGQEPRAVYCWGANDKAQLGDPAPSVGTPRLVDLSRAP